ncbi:MAG: MotA/TolQ/ExbB proton channel family protein [Planctomycetota bacterium]
MSRPACGGGFVAGLLLLCCLPGVAAQELAARAAEVRATAEAERAATRERIATQRAELYARLRAAETTLEQARDAAVEQRTAYRRAQEQERAARAQQGQLRQEIERLRERAASLLGITLAVGSDDAAWRAALAAELAARGSRLEGAAALRLERRTVRDRQGHPAEVPVVVVGAVQELACGAQLRTAGLLRQVDGTALVAGPHPEPAMRAALGAAGRGEIAALPLDVDGSLSAAETPARWSVRRWLAAGGVFLWPILAVAGLALVLVIERAVALLRLRARPSLAREVFALCERGEVAAAHALVAGGSSPTERVLAAGTREGALGHQAREAELEAALLREEPRLERSLSFLAVLAAVAPLLGLLGTVTGMIRTFQVIAVHGTGNPRLLSGGISEALVTTQMGLLAAVPILLAHAWLGRVVDRRQMHLDECANALLAHEQAPT